MGSGLPPHSWRHGYVAGATWYSSTLPRRPGHPARHALSSLVRVQSLQRNRWNVVPIKLTKVSRQAPDAEASTTHPKMPSCRGAFNRPSSRSGTLRRLRRTSSDLHRVCLSRLCCAFRLSQPPDALFRSYPFRPCFVPVTPLGFHLQRFPLHRSDVNLSAPAAPLAVRTHCRSSKRRDFRDLRIGRVRAVGPVLPGDRRSILSWLLPSLRLSPL
jgi:hypothetical protein